ncbi:hypothetical protein GRI72_02880 [Altererythrobacter marinus]|uniref:Uncharacterized protein n=1 Tax=Pelagerythrobacter marinus TaxID=538382 RepID=A0ABW9UYL8_9SPHN|nr:hypothetical protein [Pelagerythrobacter marinus]MXO67777.1 hypothetical protein [Pelagerythrobacter marinus]
MAKTRTDPLAKRRDENYLQWRSRVARARETQRRQGEGIVTPETLRQGGLVEGYAPTQERARTYHRKQRSALKAMHDRGSLSSEQFGAALQIARIAERIEREAGVSCASMEARVDCSGSASDKLVESLYDVRAERAYTQWRQSLPIPRRMIVDMVLRDHRLKAIASRYNMGWPKAQRLLGQALDNWADIYRKAMREIGQEDVDAMHERLGTKCA